MPVLSLASMRASSSRPRRRAPSSSSASSSGDSPSASTRASARVLRCALQPRQDLEARRRQPFCLGQAPRPVVGGRPQAGEVLLDRSQLPAQVLDPIAPARPVELGLVRGGPVRAERLQVRLELAATPTPRAPRPWRRSAPARAAVPPPASPQLEPPPSSAATPRAWSRPRHAPAARRARPRPP